MEKVAVVSIDIHKRFTKALSFGEDGSILEEARIVHDHRLLMAEHFTRFPPGTPVVMEETFNRPWVADLAESAGLEPHLAHPPRLRQYAQGLDKTDRTDEPFQDRI